VHLARVHLARLTRAPLRHPALDRPLRSGSAEALHQVAEDPAIRRRVLMIVRVHPDAATPVTFWSAAAAHLVVLPKR
jgi:hypothetical protein